jgi:hypothetical protein
VGTSTGNQFSKELRTSVLCVHQQPLAAELREANQSKLQEFEDNLCVAT